MGRGRAKDAKGGEGFFCAARMGMCLVFKCLPLTLTLPPEPRFQWDAAGASVRASFVVSGNDRPHPNLLPRGEGTAIACVSLRGCALCESSRGYLVAHGFNARVCWGKFPPYFTDSAGTILTLVSVILLTGRSPGCVGVVAIFSSTSSPLMSLPNAVYWRSRKRGSP